MICARDPGIMTRVCVRMKARERERERESERERETMEMF